MNDPDRLMHFIIAKQELITQLQMDTTDNFIALVRLPKSFKVYAGNADYEAINYHLDLMKHFILSPDARS